MDRRAVLTARATPVRHAVGHADGRRDHAGRWISRSARPPPARSGVTCRGWRRVPIWSTTFDARRAIQKPLTNVAYRARSRPDLPQAQIAQRRPERAVCAKVDHVRAGRGRLHRPRTGRATGARLGVLPASSPWPCSMTKRSRSAVPRHREPPSPSAQLPALGYWDTLGTTCEVSPK